MHKHSAIKEPSKLVLRMHTSPTLPCCIAQFWIGVSWEKAIMSPHMFTSLVARGSLFGFSCMHVIGIFLQNANRAGVHRSSSTKTDTLCLIYLTSSPSTRSGCLAPSSGASPSACCILLPASLAPFYLFFFFLPRKALDS